MFEQVGKSRASRFLPVRTDMILDSHGNNGIGPVGVKDHIQTVIKGVFFEVNGELGFVSG